MGREQCLVFQNVVSLIVLVLSCVVFSMGEERELNVKMNPQCQDPNQCNSTEVVYIQAVGRDDTLHYLWSFIGKPTILLVLTSHEANMSISGDHFSINNISFDHAPKYTFGFVLNELYEFDDLNDTGMMDFNSTTHTEKFSMPNKWNRVHYDINRDYVRLTMVGSWDSSQFVKNGEMIIELEAFRSQDHSEVLPHLLHSANATLLDLRLHNLTTISGFTKSRYALDFILAANESSNSSVVPNTFKSLDDEHTPGVFTLVDLKTPASNDLGKGGYVQWRPVAYIADDRDIVNSTGMVLYDKGIDNVAEPNKILNGTILKALLGINFDVSLVQAVNISFGEKEDGFYAKSNFTSWTATVGYGYPPEERFSLVVILVISIGLGLPAVLILLSCIYVALRRISSRKDDLFLSR